MPGNIVEKIDDRVRIKRVLISVFDKTGLDILVPGLVGVNPRITLLSTGGTYRAIKDILGEKSEGRLLQVSDYTGQPETQGGLVKTLDFKIYLGLLTESYNPRHQDDLKRTGAGPIDMVVVNLYPFAQATAAPGVRVEEARANIDIGGPCMVRASAKNYLRVASVTDPGDYKEILRALEDNQGSLDLAHRFELAKKALAVTAGYDAMIAKFLKGISPGDLRDCYFREG